MVMACKILKESTETSCKNVVDVAEVHWQHSVMLGCQMHPHPPSLS